MLRGIRRRRAIASVSEAIASRGTYVPIGGPADKISRYVWSQSRMLPMPKRHQLQLEIPPELHTLLVRAAVLRGQTLEDFVIESLRLASEAAVPAGDMIHLSKVAQEAFARAMLNPPPPNAAMKRAFSRHKKLFR